MNSRKKRKEQQPMVEDLIVTEAPIDVKASEKSKNRSNSTLSDTKYDPRIPELDDNADDLIITDRNKKKNCFMNDTLRHYVITISTLLFAIVSLGLGIWLICMQKRSQTGFIALIIGILLLVPASYGFTRIIQQVKEQRKAKQGKGKGKDDITAAYVNVKI